MPEAYWNTESTRISKVPFLTESTRGIVCSLSCDAHFYRLGRVLRREECTACTDTGRSSLPNLLLHSHAHSVPKFFAETQPLKLRWPAISNCISQVFSRAGLVADHPEELNMAPITKAFGLLSLLLSTITTSAAQPSGHRVHSRYLHPDRGLHSHPHAARHVIEPLSTSDDKSFTEYNAKLALRHAALSSFERIESAEIQQRDIDSRQETNAELQERINELETAFQSLIALLAADHGVTFGMSSETDSSPAPTTMPVPESIIAVSTTTDTPSSTSTPTPSVYTFSPMSSSNVAVYYAQTDQTSSVQLTEVCSDPSVDIVILAFVNNFFTPYPTGPYPTLNLGPNCLAASFAQTSAGATGLIDCVSDGFADLVRSCQSTSGKKVLLSLGGAVGYSDTRIPNDTMANTLADTLWNLFLGGSGLESIRPFGDVVLDGIDMDNEDPANAAHLSVLISSLRQLFASNNAAAGGKDYYLSAAPQCPRPDQNIPWQSLQTQIDFVWPQFYNNPACDLNSNGFIPNLQAWASDLEGTQQSDFGNLSLGGFMDIGNGVSSPRVLVGSPAFSNTGSGFVEGPAFEQIVAQVKGANLGGQSNEASPLGGFMFWDGAYGEESASVDEAGVSYMQIVKDILG
jgi:chitinase